jgi:hypothetical protein
LGGGGDPQTHQSQRTEVVCGAKTQVQDNKERNDAGGHTPTATVSARAASIATPTTLVQLCLTTVMSVIIAVISYSSLLLTGYSHSCSCNVVLSHSTAQLARSCLPSSRPVLAQPSSSSRRQRFCFVGVFCPPLFGPCVGIGAFRT